MCLRLGATARLISRACHDFGRAKDLLVVTFEEFVEQDGSRLRAALVAAYGIDVGSDATADALAYGWEHWSRVSVMDNPVGYLFRAGQNAARRSFRRPPLLPTPGPDELPRFEPGLVPALAALSEQQRVAVVLVHGYGWSMADVARLFDITHSSVRTHVARALERLQSAMEVKAGDDGR